MKKLFSACLVLVGFTTMFSQEKESDIRKNDVTMGPIELIVGPILNVSYERLINKTNGVGVNTLVYFADNAYREYQISPFYRMYFGRKFASGFFVEAFAPITTDRNDFYDYDINTNGNIIVNYREKKYTTVGFGIGLGAKWAVRNNILFEVSGGLARRFGDQNNNFEEITGKAMLGIGYRF